MKLVKLFIIFFILLFSCLKVSAVEFRLLVLPTDLFSVCDNYFCFPEVSNVMAEDVINNLYKYKGLKPIELSEIRYKFENNLDLKLKTEKVLKLYANDEKVDFNLLKEISNAFDAKSVLLITNYATNDIVNTRRNLWDILEISSAFNFTYPFELKTATVLTDCVNDLIMWSGRYSKQVSNTKGLYAANDQSQAMSQLEKVKLYSKDNISQNISQNVFMRFFPRDVRTLNINKSQQQDAQPAFVPSALDDLSKPRIRKEFSDDSSKANDFTYELDDFSF